MTSPGAPVRDRVSWFLVACLSCYGFILYGLGPALDALRDELDVSRAQIGLAGSFLAVGALGSAVAGTALLRGASPIALLRAAVVCMAAGVVLVLAAVHTAGVLVAGLVIGAAGGLVLLVIPVVIEERQPHARAALLAEANLGAATAGLLAPLAVGTATLAGAGWRTGSALALVPLAALLVWSSRLVVDRPSRSAAVPIHRSRLPRSYWRWWTSLIFAVGIEFCIIFWAVDYLQEEAGLRRGPASAALGLFVGGLAAGRLAGGRLAVSHKPRDLLVLALAVTLAGFTLFWWAPSAGAALGGLLMTGAGVAMLYPLSLSLSMAAAPGQAGAASARASLASGLAILIAPFGLAALADGAGARGAFLVVYGLIGGALVVGLGGRGSAARDAR